MLQISFERDSQEFKTPKVFMTFLGELWREAEAPIPFSLSRVAGIFWRLQGIVMSFLFDFGGGGVAVGVCHFDVWVFRSFTIAGLDDGLWVGRPFTRFGLDGIRFWGCSFF